MAYGNGRSSSWRKKRNSIVIEQRVTEPQQIHVEGERQAMVQSIRSIKQDEEVGTVEESAQHKEDTRVITRIIDDVKLELLSRCVLGFCRKPRQIFDLANEFHRAYLSGFRLMRVVGSLALLIFYSFEERKRTLELKRLICVIHEIWHMNRLWEDNMLEDWRVLESSVAELGKRNGEVPGVGTALVVAEVDEPGLNVSNEVLGRMRGIWHWFFAWPRSDVPRAGKAATIDLNGEQRRVRQLFEISLSILSSVERCEAERRLNKKEKGRPRKKPLPEQGVANASLSYSYFMRRQHVFLWEALETVHLERLIGAETVGNEVDIVKDIAHIIEARGVGQ
ncbi:hypothetical protein V6N13_108953 [Hibiscus sabdariffa]